MNRSLIAVLIAILLILATSLSLAAQGRGHFGGGAGLNRGGAGFNIPPVVRPGPSVAGRPPFAVAPSHVPSFGSRPIHPGRPVRSAIVPPVFGYGYYSPYIWPTTPFYGAPDYSVYSTPAYSEPAYAYPETQPPAVSQNEIDLAYQVGQLSAQVEQLRQQQSISSYTQPSSSPGSAGQSTKTPTVLVFRDGHRMEIQNYAIVGPTLWVLDDKVSTKISVSDLDVDATEKENHSRGMRFQLPGQ
jgi:hypothetical protein